MLDLLFKIAPISDRVAKFRGDRRYLVILQCDISRMGPALYLEDEDDGRTQQAAHKMLDGSNSYQQSSSTCSGGCRQYFCYS